MEAFEQLQVWKRSSRLSVNLYKSLVNCNDYGLRDQVTRAAVSIPSNIAEGFERNSNKQFAHYLQIAKGSCGELRPQLYICSEIGVLDTKVAREYRLEAVEISNMLSGITCNIAPRPSPTSSSR